MKKICILAVVLSAITSGAIAQEVKCDGFKSETLFCGAEDSDRKSPNECWKKSEFVDLNTRTTALLNSWKKVCGVYQVSIVPQAWNHGNIMGYMVSALLLPPKKD